MGMSTRPGGAGADASFANAASVLMTIASALLAGLLVVFLAYSQALVVFHHDLRTALPTGVTLALWSTVVMILVGAKFSSHPGTIFMPHSVNSVAFFVAAGATLGHLTAASTPEVGAASLVLLLVLSSAAVAVVSLGLSLLRGAARSAICPIRWLAASSPRRGGRSSPAASGRSPAMPST